MLSYLLPCVQGALRQGAAGPDHKDDQLGGDVAESLSAFLAVGVGAVKGPAHGQQQKKKHDQRLQEGVMHISAVNFCRIFVWNLCNNLEEVANVQDNREPDSVRGEDGVVQEDEED